MIERLIRLLSANLGHASQHSNDDYFDLEVIVLLQTYLLVHNCITLRVDNQIEVLTLTLGVQKTTYNQILLGIVYAKKNLLRLRTEEKY